MLTSDVLTSDVLTSDLLTSDVLSSDLLTGDLLTSDLLTSDVRHPCSSGWSTILQIEHYLKRAFRWAGLPLRSLDGHPA